MTRRLTIGAAVAVSALCRAMVSAQVPAGAEFRVNAYTSGHQFADRQFLASSPSGEYVVVWESPQDGSGYGIHARRLTREGASIGGEFLVNTTTASDQGRPSVAFDGRGGFVVVWHGLGPGDQQGVFGQRYHGSGAPNGVEFRVNTYVTSSQAAPTVAANRDGSFVVVWTSYGQDGSLFGIFGQRYDPSGRRVGPEFQVNTYTTGWQVLPSIDADTGGRFVVVWRSREQDGSGYGVFGQRFDANGDFVGLEFRLNSTVAGDQSAAMVAANAEGGFVAVWHDREGTWPFIINRGIRGRRFDAQGSAIGPEFAVNTYTSGLHYFPDVATDSRGNFVVTWANLGQDGSQEGVYGQRFDAAGARRGLEFRVNTFTTASQSVPAVAADSTGNFVISWTSWSQDGSLRGLFGQRFGGLFPKLLSVDEAGNGVFEAGEAASIGPGWRNSTGSTQTFGGALSAFTGPGGPSDPVYSVLDGTASYGTVANGGGGSCLAASDCYVVQTTVPTSRPVVHWDAALREGVVPDAQGQVKLWTLHVGESFTDVAPSSPFYRFVETVLHASVTAGCTGTTYCPAASIARDAMAVFVLAAREGPGYAPPVCGVVGRFADVPVTNPFCPWVEELFHRGVVAGCGGGNYCPTSPVSREQMPVFVLRALDPAIDPPPCTVAPYGDVPVTSPFCRWILELTNRGVVSGCGGGLYCPTAPVTREQAAVFVVVAFGLQLYGP